MCSIPAADACGPRQQSSKCLFFSLFKKKKRFLSFQIDTREDTPRYNLELQITTNFVFVVVSLPGFGWLTVGLTLASRMRS